MRVAYATTYDPRDRLQWSGTPYAILRALADQDIRIDALGPLALGGRLAGRLRGQFYKRLMHRVYDHSRSVKAGSSYAHQIRNQLSLVEDYDLVLSLGSSPIARLECRQPIVIWADATFTSYVEQNGLVGVLCQESIAAGHTAEKLAFQRAALLIFASDWAARSAIADYGADPAKVKTVPFGANFTRLPDRQLVNECVIHRDHGRCQLISIGNNWLYKGMQRSIDLAQLLNDRGIPTFLTIVGCNPPAGATLPKFVTVTGFIDKKLDSGEQAISTLLLQAHFHVLFTKSEAFGIVFAEANAHGVPNIAADVGGVASAVINGAGGQRFDPLTPLNDVADYIVAHLADRDAYRELAIRSRREFEERLNWKVSGAVVRRHLESLLPHEPGGKSFARIGNSNDGRETNA